MKPNLMSVDTDSQQNYIQVMTALILLKHAEGENGIGTETQHEASSTGINH